MLALFYVFAIWCVAFILYVTVNKFEPDRRLAFVLKFLTLAVGAAAIARRLMHSGGTHKIPINARTDVIKCPSLSPHRINLTADQKSR